jgi:hypothetical protein
MPTLTRMPKGQGQQQKASTITRKINQYHTQPPIRLTQGGGDNNPVSNEFPGHLIPQDNYDDVFAMKQRFAKNNPYTNQAVQFVSEITSEDTDYIKRKQDVQNSIRYQQWLASTIDMSNPAQVALARDKGILSDYFTTREETIDKYHDLSKQIAKMRLRGRSAWTAEDYQLAYAIKSGVIKLPQGSLFNPTSYLLDDPKDADADNAKRGFFNPKRLFSTMSSKYLRDKEDPFPELGGVNPQPDDNISFVADVFGTKQDSTSAVNFAFPGTDLSRPAHL